MDGYASWHAVLGRERKPAASANVEGDHYKNFVDAVRSRDAGILNCNIEEGHKSTVLCHMANASYRTGRSLEFDPVKEEFVGDDEANKMLSRDYREPYVVPENV